MAWADWIRGEVEIEPSLYAADFSRLGEQIRELLAAGARIFHFDVGDAHFVPPVTIGPVVLRSIAPGINAAQRKALTDMILAALKTRSWAESLEKNGWTPAVLAGPAFDKFVDDEFASLRATMVKSGMV